MSYDTGSDRIALLALLLAGGGPRCRRLLASRRETADPLTTLDRAGVPPALLRTASSLIE